MVKTRCGQSRDNLQLLRSWRDAGPTLSQIRKSRITFGQKVEAFLVCRGCDGWGFAPRKYPEIPLVDYRREIALQAEAQVEPGSLGDLWPGQLDLAQCGDATRGDL